jgi:outer membrane protein OmpA-like peptidoglycan-associated protein
MKKKSTINEEIKRMKSLMKFDIGDNSHDILSEQNINLILEGKLKGNSEIKKGIYTTVPPDTDQYGAIFKNKSMFSKYIKNEKLYIKQSFNYDAGPKGEGLLDKDMDVEVDVATTDEPDEKLPVSINLKFALNDPFKFDEDNLYPKAQSTLNEFINKMNNLKESGVYSSEAVDAYYEFLKTKTIPIYGFASIDALSNFMINGSSKTKCGTSGDANKQLRKDYNKCLSRVRAEKIESILKSSGGILSELKYDTIGRGETNFYSKKKWDHNESNPSNDKKSPFSTEDTKKDRRFSVMLPNYTYESPSVEPTDDENTEVTNQGGGTNSTLRRIWNPEALKVLMNDDEFSQSHKNNNIHLEKTQPTLIRKDSIDRSMMDQNCIKWDQNIVNPQDKQKGDFVFIPLEECFNKLFNIGKFGGLGKDIMVEVKLVDGSNDFVILSKSLEEKLGSGWRNKYTFEDVRRINGKEFNCELTKDKLTIGEYSFKINNDLSTTPKMIMVRDTLSNDKGEEVETYKIIGKGVFFITNNP